MESPGRAILGQVDLIAQTSLLRGWHLGDVNQNLSEHICLWLSFLLSSPGPEDMSGTEVTQSQPLHTEDYSLVMSNVT